MNSLKKALIVSALLVMARVAFSLDLKPGTLSSGSSSSSSGISTGAAVSGGAANAVLYENESQVLSADGTDLTFDGAILTTQQAVIFGTGTSTSLSITQAGSNDAGIDLAVGNDRYKLAIDNSLSDNPLILGYCSSATPCEPVDEFGLFSFQVTGSQQFTTFGSRTRPPHTYFNTRREWDFYSSDNANSSSILHLWGSRSATSNRLAAFVAHNGSGNDSGNDRLAGSLEFYTGPSDIDEGMLDIYLHDATTNVRQTMRMTAATTSFYTTAAENARFDGDSTAGNTRFMLYDVDNGTLERVTVGDPNSGGSGFKVLRIPN